MKIIIHRGSHQIGGCVTEIATANTKIMIDIGANLPGTSEGKELDIAAITKDADAVLLTHYHGDHVGEYSLVPENIPIYMGKTAKEIMLTVQKKIEIMDHKANSKRVEGFHTLSMGKRFVIGDFQITPFCVDHSAYDAYMFLLEAEGKRILHTGDFRTHGYKGKGIEKIQKAYVGFVDCLIIEGTMLSRTREIPLCEAELRKKATELLRYNNLFVLCSSTNIDTIASFYQATQANRKLFVCDTFQKSILEVVSNSAWKDIYKMDYSMIHYLGREDTIAKMKSRGFCSLVRVPYGDNDSKGYRELMHTFPEAKFVYSMWGGYLKKDSPTFHKRMADFVPKDYISLHTSGHASVETIKMVCETTKAKVIIPIHGEKTDEFAEIIGDTNHVKVLKDGESFDL
jgi:ribonuclease J